MAISDILYHYCKTDSFVSIIRNRSIRLSSLSLSNDSMEGRLVKATILRLAEREGLDERATAQLQESLAFVERYIDGLGFCLSAHGDLLSQWRGYADDASGVSIGFGRPYLESLTKNSNNLDFGLHEVKYKKPEHEAEIEDTYRELRNLIDAGAFKRTGTTLLDARSPLQMVADDAAINKANAELLIKLFALAPKLYKLKAWAFSEEKEWRLVSVLEGNTFENCEYRANRDRVIPFQTIPLTEMKFKNTRRKLKAIKEIILGPKHETPVSVIQAMLKQNGFSEVRVKKSKATYR